MYMMMSQILNYVDSPKKKKQKYKYLENEA